MSTRGPTWYRRLQASLLSVECAKYDAAVEDRKRRLFGSLSGDVVEIGPGAGANLGFLPRGVRWVGVEPNPFLHELLREAAARVGVTGDVCEGRAEMLPIRDASVDAVIASLVLCSVDSQEDALREIVRVLKPGGRFVFIEHVAEPGGGPRAWGQRLLRPLWRIVCGGCRPDRRTWVALGDAGFSTVRLEHFRAPVPVVGPHIAGTAVK